MYDSRLGVMEKSCRPGNSLACTAVLGAHSLASRPWAIRLATLSLTLHICKIGVLIPRLSEA